MNLIGLTYLGLLLFSIAGLVVLDHRYRVAAFADPRRTLVAVGSAVLLFLGWDTAGIALGIFARGDVDVMTGIELWPEMPVEEPVFLVLLTYLTLLLWRLLARGRDGGSRGSGPSAGRRVTRAGTSSERPTAVARTYRQPSGPDGQD